MEPNSFNLKYENLDFHNIFHLQSLEPAKKFSGGSTKCFDLKHMFGKNSFHYFERTSLEFGKKQNHEVNRRFW